MLNSDISLVSNGISFIVDCGNYPMEIFCFFGTKENMFSVLEKHNYDEKSLKKFKKFIKYKTSGAGYFFDEKYNTSIIHMFNIPNSILDLSMLQHEIFHAVIKIHKAIGMELTDSSEESYAYLLDNLTTKIYTKLNMKIQYEN
jgi:hypothetical protein